MKGLFKTKSSASQSPKTPTRPYLEHKDTEIGTPIHDYITNRKTTFSPRKTSDFSDLEKIIKTGHYDINAKNAEGKTPLLLAFERDVEKVKKGKKTKHNLVKFLIKNGAKVRDIDGNGNNIIHFLVENISPNLEENIEIIKSFLKQDVSLLFDKNKDGKTAYELLFEEAKDQENNHAKKRGSLTTAALDSPLKGKQNSEDRFLQLQYLKEILNPKPYEYKIQFLTAAGEGNIEEVHRLLNIDKNLKNTKDKDGNNALFYATQNGQHKMVEYLGGKIKLEETKNNAGVRPSEIANTIVRGEFEKLKAPEFSVSSSTSTYDIVDLNTGAVSHVKGSKKIEMVLDNGKTDLHIVVESGKFEDVEKLLKSGSQNINIQDNEGNTPLHLAAKSAKNIKIVELLLHNGAKTDVENKTPKLAIDIAMGSGALKVVELLNNFESKDIPKINVAPELEFAGPNPLSPFNLLSPESVSKKLSFSDDTPSPQVRRPTLEDRERSTSIPRSY